MKRISGTYRLISIAATLVISISSCKKEEEPKPTNDLTVSIVGTYIGTETREGKVFIDQSVNVSKLSDTRIQIRPPRAAISFYADLAEETGGIRLTVPSQVAGSITIKGNSLLTSSDPNAHGIYQTSDHTLHYNIVLTESSSDWNIEYLGTKQ